jgi:hypothetical protein
MMPTQCANASYCEEVLWILVDEKVSVGTTGGAATFVMFRGTLRLLVLNLRRFLRSRSAYPTASTITRRNAIARNEIGMNDVGHEQLTTTRSMYVRSSMYHNTLKVELNYVRTILLL